MFCVAVQAGVRRAPLRFVSIFALAVGFSLTAWTPGAFAQDKPATVAPLKKIQLTPAELKEREGRKACKIAICDAYHNHQPGPDVKCAVLKSWRKEQIQKKIAKGRVSWPWGGVRCTTNINIERSFLIDARLKPQFEGQLKKHTVDCELARGGDKKPYKIQITIAPKVTFEGGKAVKAKIGWGKITAPLLAKGALWTATAADNTLNVLQKSVVEDINVFFGPKCTEVADGWKKK
ncbi:MAG: hypothetical protein AAFR04_04325 [Pseudomonadota bacterium]